MRKALQSTDDMLPAQVVAYDRNSNRATVQPLIRMVTTTGQQVSRAQIASVPVFNIGGGGFVLSFPLVRGDLGWIKASDRDISLFLQHYTEASPNTARLHTFADAVFIPDVMTGWNIDEADASRVVLQSLDGSVKITLGTGIIKMRVGEASLTMTETGINSTVPITAPDFVIPGGVTLATHLTSGVSTGIGVSGVPVPP